MKNRIQRIVLIFSILAACVCISQQTLSVFAAEDLNSNIDELIEGLDVSGLQEYLNSLSVHQKELFGGNFSEKLKELIRGDFSLDYESVFQAVSEMLFGRILEMLPTFCVICSISLLCGILEKFKSSFSEKGTARTVFFVGYASVLVLILSLLTQAVSLCGDTVHSLQSQMQAVFPLLLTLIATSGGSVSVAVYQPAVLFLSEIIVGIVTDIVFPSAICMCVLNMVGNMSNELKLKQFSSLFASVIKWTLGISLTAFTVFLTVQGITSATYDGLSFKAAKYAVSNSVPIIGGFLGSGFDLVIAGSVLIKNSVGSCGIVLLVIVLAAPLLQLIAFHLFLKASAAIAEPIGEQGIASFLSSLSGTINYFTAGLLAVGFMYFITVLLLICSSNTFF